MMITSPDEIVQHALNSALADLSTITDSLQEALPLLLTARHVHPDQSTRMLATVHDLKDEVLAILECVEDAIPPDQAYPEPGWYCTLCHSVMTPYEAWVPTRPAGRAHLDCAEQDAARVWAQRRADAQGQALCSLIICVGIAYGSHSLLVGFIIGVMLFVLHIFSNQRWWYHIGRQIAKRLKEFADTARP